MAVPITLASVIAALLFVPALNLIGFTWRWSWLSAITLAAALGLAAARSLDLI
jgi:hypothetical protein